ncbi:hypothetical protein [Actinopolymorpha pittospori]|uniref:Uncharacterized protein n=1 Tax=Actinopolymorpha pittospori TaxID=648752 RepID=A0A927RFZ6_9ACTN|nr:hypothetical protein [Actinopolymorpha pittospori]MBE1603751.1 hypothetical protein [Actinopolymorpha pittospori]
MRVAITGHRGLPAETERLVDEAIRAKLARWTGADLVGPSCLADGADQISARAVLDAGGQLEFVVPAAKYREGLPVECHAAYDELLGAAESVRRLDHIESDEQAHMDASRSLLKDADHLVAVWDGKPARGYGGTAEVVALAGDLGVDVTVIWPDGATRD